MEDLHSGKIGNHVLTTFHMPLTAAPRLGGGSGLNFPANRLRALALISLQCGDVDIYNILLNEAAAYQTIGTDLRILPMDDGFKDRISGG